MKNPRVYRCEWPGCGWTATSLVRRGIYMRNLRVCEAHLRAFQALPDPEATEVSRRRQEARQRHIGQVFAGRYWFDV